MLNHLGRGKGDSGRAWGLSSVLSHLGVRHAGAPAGRRGGVWRDGWSRLVHGPAGLRRRSRWRTHGRCCVRARAGRQDVSSVGLAPSDPFLFSRQGRRAEHLHRLRQRLRGWQFDPGEASSVPAPSSLRNPGTGGGWPHEGCRCRSAVPLLHCPFKMVNGVQWCPDPRKPPWPSLVHPFPSTS